MALVMWVKAVLAGAAALVLAPIVWAALTGAVAGILDGIGVVIPAATFLAVTPFVAVLSFVAVALWVVS